MSERADFKTRFSSERQPAVAGRKAGSRNKLSQDFLGDLRDVYATHGKAALLHVAQNEQAVFFKALIALQPKEVEIIKPEDELDTDRLESIYAAISAELDARAAKRETEEKTVN